MILDVLRTPNPQMVTLGRLSRGWTQAELADRIGAKQGTISRMESGTLPISDGELDAIAVALEYPPSFFLRRDAVDGTGVIEMYHARRRKTVRTMALNRAYAIAAVRRSHMETLLRSRNEPESLRFPIFPADEFGDPERVARTVRAQFELPVGPIYSMTGVIEGAGGFIIECDFGSHMIDGFTKWRGPTAPPLFFVNRTLAPDRWRWTLAHELGHAVMHTMQYPSDDMEHQADLFAQEFLMPSQYIKPQLLGLNFPKLAGLKNYWKVSIQALIMRAHQLKVISPRQRTYLLAQWSRAGYRVREPEELDPPAEPPKAVFELVLRHLRQLGYTMAELAQALNLLEAEFRAYYLRGTSSLKAVT